MRSNCFGVRVLLLAASLSLLSCGQDVSQNGNDHQGDPTFRVILEQVFEPSCVMCHRGGRPAGEQDLTEYAKILNVPSVQRSEFKRVEPNDPSNSYLYMKMNDDDRIVGTVMPPSGILPQGQLNLVRSWIEAGAPN